MRWEIARQISVNQIGHFEEGQKIKSKWGEKLQGKLLLTKLVTLKRDKKLKVSEVRNCNTN